MERNNGLDFATLLLLIFIVLKLTKVISWSWWWVLSPIWIPLGIGVVAVFVLWATERRG